MSVAVTETATAEAASSLAIVITAALSPNVTPTGPDRSTTNVSFGSTAVSPTIGIAIVAVVAPTAKIAVPDAAMKSEPALAVPGRSSRRRSSPRLPVRRG